MTVYLPKGGKSWYYDYRWKGQRHWGATHQLRREDAQLVEAGIKLRQRQESGGIAPFDVAATPRIQKWAAVYLKSQKKFIGRPDLTDRTLETVLEFWGARPATPKRRPKGTNAHPAPAPYHDLRLGHPIADPAWIEKFERWIEKRGVSGSTRNSYLSALSGMYRLARQPQFRAIAKVPSNPFLEIRRSPRNGRVIALSIEQVRAWITAAPAHVRAAIAIAALAPKMRLRTILDLDWQIHFDQALTRIVVAQHKTRAASGAPQVTPVSPQLREILEVLRGEARAGPVIHYHDEAVQSIKRATRRAAEDSGLVWGVSTGVTFHTIRHSIATLLAELGIGERLRMELMGHGEIRTTQQYTHLAAMSQVAPHEQLSDALPIKDLVLASSAKRAIGQTFGTDPRKLKNQAEKGTVPFARAK